MGKFDGVLLASDFDNTILNTERPRRTGCPIPPISQRNVEALHYFMNNGGRFAVATGRALPAFRMFAEQVPMNAPVVVCNGGALYDFKTERYLETMELPETIRPQGQDVLDRFPTAAVEAYHMDNVIHAVRPNEYTRQHEHVTHAGVEFCIAHQQLGDLGMVAAAGVAFQGVGVVLLQLVVEPAAAEQRAALFLCVFPLHLPEKKSSETRPEVEALAVVVE